MIHETSKAKRLNLTLDPERGEALSEMAKRLHLPEGTLARSLLSAAIDASASQATRITDILDHIPGAWESAEEGMRQVEAGEGRHLVDR